MNNVRSFIEWLSFHPTPSDIARALVTEYLSSHGAASARFSCLNTDDSLTFIGEYGFAESLEGQSFLATEWRNWRGEASEAAFKLTAGNWNEKGTICLIPLRDHGAVHGYVSLEFNHPVTNKDQTYEALADLCVPISIYFAGEKLINKKYSSQSQPVNENLRDNSGQLTARQLKILQGMVEGKTNHDMASEMGYSVSTIRHETMRIYQALSVSDRKEAARQAITLSLV